MLSLITTGRNDDYGGGFVDRFRLSLMNNCSLLEDLGIEYEYLVVEWNPIKEFFSVSDKTKFLFKNFKVKDVIIDKSLIRAEGLNEAAYYEYFSKNAGLRRAKYDNILIINSDLLINEELGNEIKELITKGLDKTKFYRARYRHNANIKYDGKEPIGMSVVDKKDLHEPHLADACICGAYSGDILLCNKETLFENGRGYNELDPDHRVTFQTGMDGEILWNMYHRGIRLEFLQNPYIHIAHGKPNVYDGVYRDCKYENKPNWGFVDYNETEIPHGVILHV